MQSLTMKKIISIGALILAIFLALHFSADAQEEQNTTDEVSATTIERQNSSDERQQENAERVEARQDERSELREERQDERSENIEARQELQAERVETRQNIQAERKGALEAARQERVMNLSANISNRMDAAILRIENIIERFAERIEKISATGVNVDAARNKLNEASRLLEEAKNKISNIDSLVYNATTSNEPRSEWQKVKATYKEAGTLIRASHAALRETLALLKTALGEADRGINEAVSRNETEVTE